MAISEKLIRGEEVRTCRDLLEVIRSTKFYIYGAGYVGRRFYQALQKYGLQENVYGFITTKETADTLMGLPINTIDKISIKESTLICLAVHESLCQEITMLLQTRGFYNYIWIYPYLYEFLLGQPIQENLEIPVKKIIENSPGDWLAIWYMAIDQYYGKNDYGYSLYVRAWNLSGELNTAKGRLQKFKELIGTWDLHGYDEASSISVLDNYHVIDGSHRVSLAVYHGLSSLWGRMYAYPDSMNLIHDKNILLPREFLLEHNFEPDIIDKIDDVKCRIKRKLGL